MLDAGINPIASVHTIDGARCPAVLISSSPHKVGSSETPWQDVFDSDNGYIRYFGDNKRAGDDPNHAEGNRVLIRQREIHQSPNRAIRQNAVPILFFRRVAYEGRAKGNVVFQGLGVIQRAELITQYNSKVNDYFSNLVFEFAVLSLSHEKERLGWEWIKARRDSSKTLEETHRLAPEAWKRWVNEGPASIEKYRRRVSKLRLTRKDAQQPVPNSREQRILNHIYSFYEKRRSHFELLASLVVKSVISQGGAHYVQGWVTPPSGDHGADFVGRVDLGSDPGKVKIVVFGQAKCEDPRTATSGRHIARTVARLKRGWIGAYVTTSFFSEPVQQEIIEDQYPILLINGLQLVQEVDLLAREGGHNTINEYLESVDKDYKASVSNRRPEEILFD